MMFKNLIMLFSKQQKTPIYTKEEALNELTQIEDYFQPSSMKPLGEGLFRLYNFKLKTELEISTDINQLIEFKINTVTRDVLGCLRLLTIAHHTPINQSGLLIHYQSKEPKPRSFLNWLVSFDNYEECVKELDLWLRIAIRVHYEDYREGSPGDYDAPITSNERNLVKSHIFKLVIQDYIELIKILVDCAEEGVSLEKSIELG